MKHSLLPAGKAGLFGAPFAPAAAPGGEGVAGSSEIAAWAGRKPVGVANAIRPIATDDTAVGLSLQA